MMARSLGASSGAGFSTTPRMRVQPGVVAVPGRVHVDHAVAAGLLVRHRHDRERGAARALVGVHQLADAGSRTGHDVVRQDDREGLVADQLLGHEHGVPEAELLLLAHVADLGHVADAAHPAQHLDVAARFQQRFQLEAVVEVVLDGTLLAARDDDDLLDAGRHRLLDGVLDDRLVDERQHLLGLRLGGGQEASAPACGREDCLANAHRILHGALAGPDPDPAVATGLADANGPECSAGRGGSAEPAVGSAVTVAAPSGRLRGRLASRLAMHLGQQAAGQHEGPTEELHEGRLLGEQHGGQEDRDHRLEQHEDGGPRGTKATVAGQDRCGRDRQADGGRQDRSRSRRRPRRRARSASRPRLPGARRQRTRSPG